MATTLGSVLLILLGLARATGGVVLALQGPAAVDSSRISAGTAQALGIGLVVIGALAIAAAANVLRGRPHAVNVALAALGLFVVDGAVNGFLLYGRPGEGGTIVNVVAALVIGTLLCVGDGGRRRKP